MKKENLIGNLLAVFAVFIWGITFISTKILLKVLSPEEILLFRFTIAYLVLLIICPKRMIVNNFKEEVIFASLGLTGITLYFWIENLALKYTYASNVGLISSTIPIFTALLAHYITKEKKFELRFIIGFLFAIIGIFIIIYNGQILKLNPLGDLLAVLTAILFAVYSVILKFVRGNYSQIYITKKIFFYGMVFVLPIAYMKNISLNIEVMNFSIIGNLLFLSIIASVLCFIMWNKAVVLIGSVKATNYIYFVPMITMIASNIFLKERITLMMAMGGLLIFIGVYVNGKTKNKIEEVLLNEIK
ncbi:MAG: DMT family transporter [Fusobacteriaceae bacterium]|nr:DMT family transporter [Fusobacteriaceae bacterium]